MAEIRQYMEILLESLKKKKTILQKILEENEKQEKAIKENSDMEAFDRIVRDKRRLIWDLESLDSGFDSVYNRIKEELPAEKAAYKQEIAHMQELISEITALSVRIQATEQRNKQLVESYFAYAKGKIKQAKKSVRAANDYYKNMSRGGYGDSALMDQKK